jgi:hypothetical protein
MEEKILCAAIWYKELPRKSDNRNDMPVNIKEGMVICGHRHSSIIGILQNLTGLRSVESESGKQVQGFLTNLNRFVDRKEAAVIAMSAGQVLSHPEGLIITPDKLYSEDLY